MLSLLSDTRLTDTPWDRPDRKSSKYTRYLSSEIFDYDPWNRFDRDALSTSTTYFPHPALSISRLFTPYILISLYPQCLLFLLPRTLFPVSLRLYTSYPKLLSSEADLRAHSGLITGMLTPDPARRMTLKDVFHHPWMMRCVSRSRCCPYVGKSKSGS